jgi:uncharacterized Zn finger protein (UPF0148 family)
MSVLGRIIPKKVPGCPHCEVPLKRAGSDANGYYVCPSCERSFGQQPKPEGKPLAARPYPSAPPSMRLNIFV